MASWKDIPEYEGLYKVSELGKVASVGRFCKQGDHLIFIKSKILKQSVMGKGYACVSLHKNGVSRSFSIHRIVALTFLTPPHDQSKKTVNHKNGDKKDNRISNLEWASYRENNIHSIKILNRRPGNPRKTIVKMDIEGNEIEKIVGVRSFCQSNGFHYANISRVARTGKGSAHGFKWKYL